MHFTWGERGRWLKFTKPELIHLLREAFKKKKNSKCKLFPKGEGGESTPKFTFFKLFFDKIINYVLLTRIPE